MIYAWLKWRTLFIISSPFLIRLPILLHASSLSDLVPHLATLSSLKLLASIWRIAFVLAVIVLIFRARLYRCCLFSILLLLDFFYLLLIGCMITSLISTAAVRIVIFVIFQFVCRCPVQLLYKLNHKYSMVFNGLNKIIGGAPMFKNKIALTYGTFKAAGTLMRFSSLHWLPPDCHCLWLHLRYFDPIIPPSFFNFVWCDTAATALTCLNIDCKFLINARGKY